MNFLLNRFFCYFNFKNIIYDKYYSLLKICNTFCIRQSYTYDMIFYFEIFYKIRHYTNQLCIRLISLNIS